MTLPPISQIKEQVSKKYFFLPIGNSFLCWFVPHIIPETSHNLKLFHELINYVLKQDIRDIIHNLCPIYLGMLYNNFRKITYNYLFKPLQRKFQNQHLVKL